jgi:hypothetical protein
MEVAPSSTPDQRARFKALAQTLHQLWFIERPSPLSTGTGSPAPAPLTDPTDPIITQEAL